MSEMKREALERLKVMEVHADEVVRLTHLGHPSRTVGATGAGCYGEWSLERGQRPAKPLSTKENQHGVPSERESWLDT